MGRQMCGQLLQQGQKALTITHTACKAQLPVTDSKLQINRVLPLVFTCAQGQFLAVNLVQRHFGGIQAAHHTLNVIGAQATGVKPADHSAHARPHQPGNPDAVTLQSSE